MRKAPALKHPSLEALENAIKARSEASRPTVTETIEEAGGRRDISLPSTRIHTLEQLIEHCKIDLSIWEVERFVCNKWEVGAKDDAGKIIVEPLFQVKATLRRRKELFSARRELEAMKNEFKAWAKPCKSVVSPKRPSSGYLLEVNIPDAHFGKLAWDAETGWGNYDTAIAEKTWLEAVEALIERCGGFRFDRILFVVGNDLLNSDNAEGTTTRGTKVTTDGRYQKTFVLVRKTMVATALRLKHYFQCPVDIVMVGGNHDYQSVFCLGDALECWFHADPDVSVDNKPRARKYYQFGRVMIMLTHGDKGKKTDYPLLMATEQPQMFAETKYHEIHTGHEHTRRVDEKMGILIRTLTSLCTEDDWHAENGFVGNSKSAEALIWHKNEGLVGTAFYTRQEL